jgi:DNA-binding beta-propeller fold protein YncE
MLPGSTVYGVAVSPDGKTLYTTVSGTSVAVVNASTGVTEKSIPLPVSGFPEALYGSPAITPAGDRIYFCAYMTNTVVIDTSTLTIMATIASATGSLAISPNGDVVYIRAFRKRCRSDRDQHGYGHNPVGDASVAFSPDGTTAYAGAGSVYVIDTSTLAVTFVIPT